MNIEVVDSAMVYALTHSAPLTAIVGENGIFNGRVPSKYVDLFPRLVIGSGVDRDALDTEGATFSTDTRYVEETINVWALDRKQALSIYAAIKTVLNRTILDLSDGTHLGKGRISWVTDFLDVDKIHAVINYSAITR